MEPLYFGLKFTGKIQTPQALFESHVFKREFLKNVSDFVASGIGDASIENLSMIYYYEPNKSEGSIVGGIVFPGISLDSRDQNELVLHMTSQMRQANADAIITSPQRVAPSDDVKVYEINRSDISAVKVNTKKLVMDGADILRLIERGSPNITEYVYIQSPEPGKSDTSSVTSSTKSLPIYLFMDNISTSGHNPDYINKKTLLVKLLDMCQQCNLRDYIHLKVISSVIYGIYEGSLEGRTIYDTYRSNTLASDDVSYVVGDNLTLVSLVDLIIADPLGITLYAEYLQKTSTDLIDSNIAANESLISTIFHRNFYHEFVHNNDESKWYYYSKDGYWIHDVENSNMSWKVDSKIKAMYEAMHALLDDGDSNNEDKKMRSKKNKFAKTIEWLGTNRGKNQIRDSLVPRMGARLNTRFDKNYHVFKVANGVLEFDEQKKEIIFRKSRREDYSRMGSPVMYREDYSFEHPHVKVAMKYFEQVFPDPETREFRLKWNGSGMYRGNHTKIYVICIGKFNNSKSAENNIKRYVFGTYAKKAKISYLTGESNKSGSADTAISGLEDAAIITFDEPNRGDVLVNTTFIKSVTGSDDIRARKLRSEESDIKIPGKIDIITNFHIDSPPGDAAMIIRKVCIPYVSLWSNSAPENEELQKKHNHYKLDPDFPTFIKKYAEAFLWIYVQYAREWFSNGKKLVISEEMRLCAEENTKKNDFYTPYLESIYKKNVKGRVVYNVFLKAADEVFLKGRHKSVYHSDFLEQYLREWLDTGDIITLEGGIKYIKGIEYNIEPVG